MSSCQLGEPVRYDGRHAALANAIVERWRGEGRVVSVCPELAGDLGLPRPASEIADANGFAVIEGRARVMAIDGADVTGQFVKGAWSALELAQMHGVRVAVLKDGSPSCGTSYIYDGGFRKVRKAEMGVTAALLAGHGVAVFSQDEIELAERRVLELEACGGE